MMSRINFLIFLQMRTCSVPLMIHLTTQISLSIKTRNSESLTWTCLTKAQTLLRWKQTSSLKTLWGHVLWQLVDSHFKKLKFTDKDTSQEISLPRANNNSIKSTVLKKSKKSMRIRRSNLKGNSIQTFFPLSMVWQPPVWQARSYLHLPKIGRAKVLIRCLKFSLKG